MNDQLPIKRQIEDIEVEIFTFDKTKTRKNLIAYGLVGVSLLMGVLAVANPNKFTINQLSIRGDSDSPIYKVIDGVYKREAVSNPKGFAKKVEILGQLRGSYWITQWLLMGSLSGIFVGLLIHKGVSRQLLLLKQQRYELLRMNACNTDDVVKSYLEVIAHSNNAEKQSRIIEREEAFKYEHLNYTPEQIARLKTEDRRQQELQALQHELRIQQMSAQIHRVSVPEKVVTKAELPVIEGVVWFDWDWLETKDYDDIPHIRLVGSTGSGKTILGDWILEKLPGDNYILTTKRKPSQWIGKKVFGVVEDFDTLKVKFLELETERKSRLQKVSEGIEPEIVNVAIDEWRAIHNKIEEAKPIVRDTITQAREARQRLLLMAQGRQVSTFGLKDESDLEECMVSIYMGSFAKEEVKSFCQNNKQMSEESKTKLIDVVEKAGKRAAFIHSEFGDFPAIIPEITN